MRVLGDAERILSDYGIDNEPLSMLDRFSFYPHGVSLCLDCGGITQLHHNLCDACAKEKIKVQFDFNPSLGNWVEQLFITNMSTKQIPKFRIIFRDGKATFKPLNVSAIQIQHLIVP